MNDETTDRFSHSQALAVDDIVLNAQNSPHRHTISVAGKMVWDSTA